MAVKYQDQSRFESNVRVSQRIFKWAAKVVASFISGITKKPLLTIEIFDSNY
jgi:hypothetical protein